MTRFLPALAAALLAALTLTAQAQTPAPAPAQAATPAPAVLQTESIGSVATLQGTATITRNNATITLKVNDDIFQGDFVRTSINASLGITLDDDTTFTMGGDAQMMMDEFVYQKSGAKNSGTYRVLRGTVAFVAGQVAKTGSMSIDTPTATFGIRGTTGVVEVPETISAANQVNVKLYPDANGAVGRIEVFSPGRTAQLGVLTRAASGFGIGAAVGGRFSAVPLTISPQQIARDRGFVRQLHSNATIGRRMVIERRNIRQNLQRQNPQQQRQNLQQQRQNLQRQNVPPGRQQPNLQRQNLPQQNFRGTVPPGLQQRGGATPPILRQLPGTGQPAILPGVRPGQQQRVPGVRQPQQRDLRQILR